MANELRIGNLCLKGKELEVVTLKNTEEVQDANEFKVYRPMSINDGVIYGCFDNWEQENFDNGNILYTYKDNYKRFDKDVNIVLTLTTSPMGNSTITITCPLGSLMKSIDYLFEMQNLYFYLTGKELNIETKYKYFKDTSLYKYTS